jgi:sortase B
VKRRTIYAICGAVFLAIAIFCGVMAIRGLRAPKPTQAELLAPTSTPEPTPDATPTPTPTPTQTAGPTPTPTPEPTPEPTPTPIPYVSPIDFQSLMEVNEDIYGWLQIDGTNVNFPVVQSATDDTFYLDHDSDGKYSENGAVFSEHRYNHRDFNDPVTILYGHHKWSGAIFGNLQQYYTDSKFFAEDNKLKIYTPTGLLEYGVFAAVPYGRDHILYYNDFSDDEVFETFFSGILNTRDLSARFNEEYAPKAGDKVLILSTCFAGNNTRRFLVMGTLLD